MPDPGPSGRLIAAVIATCAVLTAGILAVAGWAVVVLVLHFTR